MILLKKITVGALAMISLGSCHHKDLFYAEPALTSHLQVVFDWQKAPDANPESMAAYLFNEDGEKPLRYIFDNMNGGEIKAPNGTRHIIFMNADANTHTGYRKNDNIETSELYALDAETLSGQGLYTAAVPRSDDQTNERYTMTPGMLWGGRSNGHVIAPRDGETQTITLYPEELICHYIVDIYDVDNISSLSTASVDATLSGMAEGYSLGAGQSTDTPATMTFVLTANRSEASLHAEFLTFGECATTQAAHNLTVYMIKSDGTRWWHSFDVADQITSAPDPRHVHIVLRGLPLPETPGAAISPDVNEWQTINITLPM